MPRLVLALVALVLLPAGAAHAADQTIGFEDQPAGTTLTSTYAGQGLTFGSSPSGPSGVTVRAATASTGLAHAGARVAQVGVCQVSGEFGNCTTDTWLKLSATQHRIRFYAGFYQADPPATTASLKVTALSSSQAQLVQKTVSVGSGAKTLVDLDVGASQSITYVHLENFIATGGGTPGLRGTLGLDDLTLDVPATLPPAQPDFSFGRTDNQDTTVVKQGDPGVAVPLRFARLDGSAGPITLTATGLPAGATATFTPASPFTGPDQGTVEVKLAAAGSTPAGSTTVRVIAHPQGSGAGSADRVLDLPLIVRETADVDILAIAATQAVNLDPLPSLEATGRRVPYTGLPLVSGKFTTVRVLMAAHDAPATGFPTSGDPRAVRVRLAGTRDGQPLPGSPLAPTLIPPPLQEVTLAQALRQPAFTFELPPSWQSGKVDLTATVDQGGGIEIGPSDTITQCGSCTSNDVASLDGVPFYATKAFKIDPIEMPWTRKRADGTTEGNVTTAVADALALAKETTPISDANWQVPDYIDTIDVSAIAALPFKQQYEADGKTKSTYPDGTNVDANRDGADPKNDAVYTKLYTWETDHNATRKASTAALTMGVVDRVARGKATVGAATFKGYSRRIAVVTPTRPLTSVAHEAGHALGRGHADNGPPRPADPKLVDPAVAYGCGGTDAAGKSGDPAFPGAIGAFTEGYGLRTLTAAPLSLQLYGPADYDVMSYCADTRGDPNSWISPQGWREALATTAGEAIPGIATARAAPTPAAPASGSGTRAAGAAEGGVDPRSVSGAGRRASGAAEGGTDPRAAGAAAGGAGRRASGAAAGGAGRRASGAAEGGTETRAAGAAAGGAGRRAPGAAGGGPGFAIIASLGGDGSVAVGDVVPTAVRSFPGAAASSYRASLTDRRGKVVASGGLLVTPDHVDPSPDGPAEAGALLTGTIKAPRGAQVAGLVVKAGKRVVARRKASPHAPTVRLKTPKVGKDGSITVRYTARDRDRRPVLEATVRVSTNGGKTFVPVFTGPAGKRVVIPAGRVAASRRAVVRVLVTDGFNAGVATSKRFRTTGSAPRVALDVPSAAGPVAAGARLYASASAWADGRRHLVGPALRWRVDGRPVARGVTVGLPPLPAGRHVITVTARDVAGRTRTVRREVAVG